MAQLSVSGNAANIPEPSLSAYARNIASNLMQPGVAVPSNSTMIASPDNTINTLLNNGGSQPYTGTTLDFFSPITGLPTASTSTITRT